jgi:type IV secretory pathway TrbF-like protein
VDRRDLRASWGNPSDMGQPLSIDHTHRNVITGGLRDFISRILIVEGDPAILHGLRDNLEFEGHTSSPPPIARRATSG